MMREYSSNRIWTRCHSRIWEGSWKRTARQSRGRSGGIQSQYIRGHGARSTTAVQRGTAVLPLVSAEWSHVQGRHAADAPQYMQRLWQETKVQATEDRLPCEGCRRRLQDPAEEAEKRRQFDSTLEKIPIVLKTGIRHIDILMNDTDSTSPKINLCCSIHDSSPHLKVVFSLFFFLTLWGRESGFSR